MFAHAVTAGGPLPWPARAPFRWDRSGTRRDVTVFTDTSLVKAEARDDSCRIAWLLESPRATRHEYRWLSRNARLFDRVLTFEQNLLETLPHAKFSPLGGCWLEEDTWGVYAKSANLSIIASEKRSMPGQKLRHQIIQSHRGAFDAVLGRGYRTLGNKLEGLREFRYSLAIENCRQNYYFSEKIIDCFLSGTVPIYWGCPSIGLFFDQEGIISFEQLSDLGLILEGLGPDDYAQRLPAIRRNFLRAQRYVYPDLQVWENVRDLFEAPEG